MKKQVVLDINEYIKLLSDISKKEKTIKELENKSFIIYVDHMGRIKYINNSTENVQKVYDNLVERDKVFLEKYKSKIDRRDYTIMDLEIKNKAIINSIKLQIKQYNENNQIKFNDTMLNIGSGFYVFDLTEYYTDLDFVEIIIDDDASIKKIISRIRSQTIDNTVQTTLQTIYYDWE